MKRKTGKYWLLTINNEVEPTIYGSLKDACLENGLGYRSAQRGKRLFKSGSGPVTEKRLIECEMKRRTASNPTGINSKQPDKHSSNDF